MTGLPAIDPAALPADVRTGTPAHRRAYEQALGFEQVLVQQLTKSLADTAVPATDPTDDGDDATGDGIAATGAAATSSATQMLPDALASALTQAGGLGLARVLVPAAPIETEARS